MRLILCAITASALVLMPGRAGAQQNATSIDPSEYIRWPEVRAKATRSASGEVTLSWSGEFKRVAIFASGDPDHIPRGRSLAVVTGVTQYVVPSGMSKTNPTYYWLRFVGGAMDGQNVVVAERTVRLEGAHNWRDLGGYATSDGRHIRWGMAFRSDSLAKLSDADEGVLADSLHLKTDCDLRGAAEFTAAPDRLPRNSSVTLRSFPISADGAAAKLIAAVKGPDPALVDQSMEAVYAEMVDTHADSFGAALKVYSDISAFPVVIHCSAGKDRTGIATALLLHVLGVSQETVVADYSLTNLSFGSLMDGLRTQTLLPTAELAPERLAGILLAKPIWIEHTLGYIVRKYGSIDAYLQSSCRLSEADQARIRKNLLE